MLQGVYANNLSWQHAGDSLLMTVLGGVHHVLGPLWGAIAFIMLEDRLARRHRELVADLRADPDAVRADLAGRHARTLAAAARPTALDAGAPRHSAAPRRHRAVREQRRRGSTAASRCCRPAG